MLNNVAILDHSIKRSPNFAVNPDLVKTRSGNAMIDESGNFRRQQRPTNFLSDRLTPEKPQNTAVQTQKFGGFWKPEANGRFTMVPNQFFDEIVPNEPASVTKLVGLVIRRTLGFVGPDGQRRQQAQISYSEFRREMNMSNDTVATALQIALEKGYIVKVREGRMNSKDGMATGAFYSLAWYTDATSENVNVSNQKGSPEMSKTQTAKAGNTSQLAHSNNRTVAPKQLISTATHSNNQTVAQSNNRIVEGCLKQSDFRRDINKESLDALNKVEIKSASAQDSTCQNNRKQLKLAKTSNSQEPDIKPDTTFAQPTISQAEQVISRAEVAGTDPGVEKLSVVSQGLAQVTLTEGVAKPEVETVVPDAMYKRNGSVYIQNLVRDFSRDFEDADHANSNVSHALNLWAGCGCDERDFTVYLYEARKRTRANLGASKTIQANRMPYFFSVLKELLKPQVTN